MQCTGLANASRHNASSGERGPGKKFGGPSLILIMAAIMDVKKEELEEQQQPSIQQEQDYDNYEEDYDDYDDYLDDELNDADWDNATGGELRLCATRTLADKGYRFHKAIQSSSSASECSPCSNNVKANCACCQPQTTRA